MLTPQHRILKKKDFNLVFQKGRFVPEHLFLLRYLKKKEGESRAGFVVSTKVSKKAADRNKIKRRMREIIRKEMPRLRTTGHDYVFIMKKSSNGATFAQLKESALKALGKAL